MHRLTFFLIPNLAVLVTFSTSFFFWVHEESCVCAFVHDPSSSSEQKSNSPQFFRADARACSAAVTGPSSGVNKTYCLCLALSTNTTDNWSIPDTFGDFLFIYLFVVLSFSFITHWVQTYHCPLLKFKHGRQPNLKTTSLDLDSLCVYVHQGSL